MEPLTLEERLRLRRKEWHAQQEYRRKHEERKLRMIEEYERKRAEAINKQKSLCKRRSKSYSPQRREPSSPDYEHSKDGLRRKTSVIVNGPEGIIIDKKELHKIKISIYKESSLPTNDQSTSNKIERDIVDPDDVILPRRQNEGACPIFQRSEIKKTEEIRTITFSQNEQLVSEKQSTNRKNVYTRKRSKDCIIQHDCDSSSYKSTIRRDDGTDDGDTYNRDRRRNSSIRDSKEKDKGRSERRNRSSSRCSSRSAPFIRNRSRSRYRSRSHSPISEQTKERRMTKLDYDKNKFSSERSYPGQSRKLDNRVSPKPFTNYPFSDSIFYNPYMCLSRPIPMSRIQATPMLVPVLPGLFPAPMNIHRWRQPGPNMVHQWQRNRNPH